MKFFLDTASLKEIREAASLGVLDGVTTNPSLLATGGGGDAEGRLREGRHWASLHENIVVKCPCTAEGLKATKTLSSEGHRVNMTLVFSPSQALLAAKAGASFCSPFVGRLDDISTPGMDLVRDIVQIYRNYSFSCEVLAASLRHPQHIVEAAKAGAHIGTMPLSVFQSLLKHPLTDIGL